MQKHVYRGIVLFIVFLVSVIYMGRDIKEEKFEGNTTVAMGKATFPIVSIETEKEHINILHGYSGNIDSNYIRDCITPVDSKQVISLRIDGRGNKVKKINYEIRETYSNDLIDSGSINALEEEEQYNTAKIKIKATLQQGSEYSAKITLVTDTSKKINYYTKVKMLENAHLKEKLDFVYKFHDSTMSKKKAKDITSYLEPSDNADNSSLAHVTIQSNIDLISWAELKPTIVGEVMTTVKEINYETASIELAYTVSAETPSGEEIYAIKEFYRVRWTENKMYLLIYDRTMETIFDINDISLSKSELKLGITNNTDMEILSNIDHSKIAFVRERELWQYNLEENKAVKVFSFTQEDTDYIRDSYDQHNIKILNMDDTGNIDFIVYGYMNRGDYEGRSAIVLYRYYSDENRVEEKIYIPMDVPYQILKEDLDSFVYLSQHSVFYFSINNTVYSYNIITKAFDTIVTNRSSENLLLSKEGKYIAWQDEVNPRKSKEIIIMDLETGRKSSISAPDNRNIKILGNINQNIIYGYAKTKDIAENADGTTIVPLYQVEIADMNGTVQKSYDRKGYYVVNSNIEDNIIALERVKKSSGSSKLKYESAAPDHIKYKVSEVSQDIFISSRVTNAALTEYYITLPSSIDIKEIPKVEETEFVVVMTDTTLHLKKEEEESDRFYVYAKGGIASCYEYADDAIIKADEWMGTVVNNKQQIVWQRSAKAISKTISNINTVTAGGNIDSIEACLSMLLSYNKLNISIDQLTYKESSVYGVLKEKLKSTALNLTGTELSQVLYYVSEGNPVIGMKDGNNAVLIVAYDNWNITYIDPQTGTSIKKGLGDSTAMFESAGNVFYSYIDGQ